MATTKLEKVDFKRELRDLYRARMTPSLVQVPRLSYLMIDGHGDPNVSPEFGAGIKALYSLSYGVKFALKNAGVIDYGVMPLEGLWWAPDAAPSATGPAPAWNWTLMIMQPEAVTRAALAEVWDAAEAKAPAVGDVRLEPLDEGRAAQLTHRGPYNTEGPTIAALHAFIAEHGLRAVGRHHEIYLSDPTRSAPANVKTTIRQPVA